MSEDKVSSTAGGTGQCKGIITRIQEFLEENINKAKLKRTV